MTEIAGAATPGRGAVPAADFGVLIEVADGILQARLPIPFALDHVNVYLLRDAGGWLAVDTGTRSSRTQQHWRDILAQLDGPLTRILLTHHHIDHAGLARWLSDETGAPVLMTPLEREALAVSLEPYPADVADQLYRYYMASGCDPDEARAIAGTRLHVERHVGGMPDRIDTVQAGDTLRIGEADWRIETGAGHTWESLIAHRADGAVSIIGDQILTTISPFVGIFPNSRDRNPLKTYYAFLRRMRETLPPGTLLLPGHRSPFRDGGGRAAELARHHNRRCDKVLDACRTRPHSVRDLVNVLFDRDLTDVMILAMAETSAHTAFLLDAGQLAEIDTNGVTRYTLK